MKFIRIVFIIGYLFWGVMFLQAFSYLMLRNAWIELFKIQKLPPKSIEFIPLDKVSTEIKYEFEYKNELHSGSRKVMNQIINEKIPKNHENIEISFNSQFPTINYLNQLELKTRKGYTGLIISGFFLMFLFLIDLFGDKKKWLRIYGFGNKNNG